MTVTIDSINEGASPNTAIASWSSDLGDPTFYIYMDGVFLFNTKQRSRVFTLQDSQGGVLEVFDDPSERPATTNPTDGRVRFSDNASDEYRIEKLENAVYNVKQLRKQQSGTHEYRTERIDDASGETFRITNILDNKESTPVVLSASIVRKPDPPEVNMAFSDSTKKVTITQGV